MTFAEGDLGKIPALFVEDPEYLDATEQAGIELDPSDAEQIEATLESIFGLSPELQDRLKEVLEVNEE